jgi:ribonuclease R
VVKVLQRKRRQLVGTLRKTPMFYYVLPDETRIPHDISVPPHGRPAAVGQKVVVELKDWPDRRKPPEGVITEVLGAPDAPGVDLLSIIRKHDLPTSFPEAVEQEAADIPALIPRRRNRPARGFSQDFHPDHRPGRREGLRRRALLPHPSQRRLRDFHPHRRRLPLRADRLGARCRSPPRGNSIYLVDRVIPMLPEKLSNGICSLQPHVDRLVKTAIVTLDKRAKSSSFRFAAGIIHSAKRFTYQEAFALLRKPAATPLAAASARAERHGAGAAPAPVRQRRARPRFSRSESARG